MMCIDSIKNLKAGRNGSTNGTKGSSQDETSSDSSQFPEFLNYGEEDEMEIEGYRRSIGRTVVTWIFIIATAGLLRLIFHWWPHLMLKATHRRCSLGDAEKVLVIVSVFSLESLIFNVQTESYRIYINEK